MHDKKGLMGHFYPHELLSIDGMMVCQGGGENREMLPEICNF
jgi:hypothetical protein